MRNFILLFILVLSSSISIAQREFEATRNGIKIPVVTATQRDQISTPSNGQMVYVSSTNTYWFYNGIEWIELTGGQSSSDQGPSGPGGWGQQPTYEDQSFTLQDNFFNNLHGYRFGASVAIRGTRAFAGTDVYNRAGRVVGYQDRGGTFVSSEVVAASDSSSGDRFGSAMCFDGTFLLVGAAGKNSGQGVVYAFQDNNGSLVQTSILTSSDGDSNDEFGTIIDMDGDWAAISAPNHDTGRGAVYLYQRNVSVWNEIVKLQPSNLDDGTWLTGGNFGSAIALNDPYLLIGAPAQDTMGRVYVYKRTGSSWNLVDELVPSDLQNGYLDSGFPTSTPIFAFGIDVTMIGDEIYVGAPYRSVAGVGSGGVYHFVKQGANAWIEDEILTAPDTRALQLYGAGLDSDGDHLLIIAFDASNSVDSPGAMYLYDHPLGRFITKFKTSDTFINDSGNLGYKSSDIHGDFIIAGARYKKNDGQTQDGAVYFFRKK